MKRFRITALVLSGALTLGLLAACGGGQDPAPETTPPAAATPAPDPDPTPDPTPDSTPIPEPGEGEDGTLPGGDSDPSQPEAPNEPESTQPAVNPTDPPAQTSKPTTPPPAASTPAPDPTPEPTPDLAGDPTVVQAIWNEISAMELPALAELDDATLSATYGIDSADLSDYVCQFPLMNVSATEFFIARVEDGKMDAVKAAVEQRQKDLEEQWSSYLPAQLELVQNYKLIVNGNYIFFAVSDQAGAAAEIFNTYTK